MPTACPPSFDRLISRTPGAAFVLGLVLGICPAAHGRVWIDIGPPLSGSTLPLVLDPSNPATIYTAGAASLSIQRVGGGRWEAVYGTAITNDGVTFKAVAAAAP